MTMRCPICHHDGERTISVIAPIQMQWPKPKLVLHCEVTPASPTGFRWWVTGDGMETMHFNYAMTALIAAKGFT